MPIISNAPQNLTMPDFWAITDKFGGLAKACKYAVRILPVGTRLIQYAPIMRDLVYMCEIAELPGRGFMNMDVRYYGPNHKLPFQSTYEDLNMTFLCRKESPERLFFDDWMNIINPVHTFDFAYRDEYKAIIEVFQFSETPNREYNAGKADYMITAHNAYPILVNPQPLSWIDDQFQRLVVSFTYTHWSRVGLDPEPRTSEPGGFSFQLIEGRPSTRT